MQTNFQDSIVANSDDNVLIYVVNVRIHLISIKHKQYTYINVYVCVHTVHLSLMLFP